MGSLTRGKVNRAPTHPGALLREIVLPELDVSKSELARRLNLSRQQLYDILNEQRPVTVPVALKLGKVLGNGPNVWIGMQQAYDLYNVAEDMATELDNLEVLTA